MRAHSECCRGRPRPAPSSPAHRHGVAKASRCCRPRSRRGTRKGSCDAVGASEPVPSDHHTRNRMVSGLRQFGTADRQEKPITSHPLDRGPATKWCSELRFAAVTEPAAGIQFGLAARGLFSAEADRIAATILPRVRPSGGRNRVPASSLSPPRELPSGPVSRRGCGSRTLSRRALRRTAMCSRALRRASLENACGPRNRA